MWTKASDFASHAIAVSAHELFNAMDRIVYL